MNASRVRWACLLFTVVPLGLVAQSASPQSYSTAKIAELAIPRTYTVVALDEDREPISQGSGFLVQRLGAILTNWHVIQGAHGVKVYDGERWYAFGRAIRVDTVADLALLFVSEIKDSTALPRAKTQPRIGERLVVVGSPLGLSHTVTEGIVSAIRSVGGHRLIQISAPVSHGSSGGPVLNAAAEVVGVVVSQLDDGQQLNFAVPIDQLDSLLDRGIRPDSWEDVARLGGRAPRPVGPARAHATRELRPLTPPARPTTVKSSLAGLYSGYWEWGLPPGSEPITLRDDWQPPRGEAIPIREGLVGERVDVLLGTQTGVVRWSDMGSSLQLAAPIDSVVRTRGGSFSLYLRGSAMPWLGFETYDGLYFREERPLDSTKTRDLWHVGHVQRIHVSRIARIGWYDITLEPEGGFWTERSPGKQTKRRRGKTSGVQGYDGEATVMLVGDSTLAMHMKVERSVGPGLDLFLQGFIEDNYRIDWTNGEYRLVGEMIDGELTATLSLTERSGTEERRTTVAQIRGSKTFGP